MRVEGSLDLLQARIERAKEGWRVFRAHALAVFPPEHATVLLRQRRDLVRDLPDEGLLFWVRHVDRRPDMENPGIHMAEHAVDQAAAVERGAELGDVVGEVLGRHRRILHERDRPAAALHVAEKSDGLLAHAPDTLDSFERRRGRQPGLVALGFIAVLSQPHIVLRARAEGRERCTPRCCALLALLVSRNREAAPSVAAALPFQLVCDPPDLVLEIARVVGQDLDEVHPLG